jgi:hypothetical protein
MKTMRKLLTAFALVAAYVAVSGLAVANPPAPECEPNCPWIR